MAFLKKSYTIPTYTASSAVNNAKKALDEQLKAKPQAYKSQWQTQLDDTINKILNREKFSYDFNGDALYQQYKDKFIQQGKMASADVMGQAAAMTGGYGNSYAATVGNQAYQASLQNLNDIVPELYQMALDKYNAEGQDLYNQYGIISDRENADYGKYRDTVGDWQTDRNYLASMYDSERNFDYGKFADNRNLGYQKYVDDTNLSYQDYRDTIADAKWKEEMEFAEKEYEQKNRDIEAEIAKAVAEATAPYKKQTFDNTVQKVLDEKKNDNPKTASDPYAYLDTKDEWVKYFGGIKQQYGEAEAMREFNNAASSGKLPRTYQMTIRTLITGGRGGH